MNIPVAERSCVNPAEAKPSAVHSTTRRLLRRGQPLLSVNKASSPVRVPWSVRRSFVFEPDAEEVREEPVVVLGSLSQPDAEPVRDRTPEVGRYAVRPHGDP